jgi:hypothetical protein
MFNNVGISTWPTYFKRLNKCFQFDPSSGFFLSLHCIYNMINKNRDKPSNHVLRSHFKKIGLCHEYFVFSSENHFSSKFHVNIKIDRWQLIKLRPTFAEILFSIANPDVFCWSCCISLINHYFLWFVSVLIWSVCKKKFVFFFLYMKNSGFRRKFETCVV